jgi:hypothetical protein
VLPADQRRALAREDLLDERVLLPRAEGGVDRDAEPGRERVQGLCLRSPVTAALLALAPCRRSGSDRYHRTAGTPELRAHGQLTTTPRGHGGGNSIPQPPQNRAPPDCHDHTRS